MSAISKSAFSVLALSLMSIGAANATTTTADMTLSGANIYTLNNFASGASTIQGSVVAAGNFTSNLTKINSKNSDAYGSYGVVAGKNLTETLTTVANGKYYVGGNTVAVLSTTGKKSTTLPLSFATTSAALKTESSTLDALTNTGTTSNTFGVLSNTLNFTSTSKSSVQVFDVSALALETATSYNLSSLGKDATVIINVSGSLATFTAANNFSAFAGDNVIFNFTDASAINLALGAGTFYGNILATGATLTGTTGTIDGNVVVNNWISTLLNVKSGYGFSAVLPGTPLTTAVPEPETYAMLFAGLGLIGFMARKRKAA